MVELTWNDPVSNVHVSDPILDNDHCTIGLHLALVTRPSKLQSRLVWNYNRADFDGFREALGTHDWETCFRGNTVDDAAELWTATFLDIAKRFIPNKVVTIRPDDVPWYNNRLRRLRCKKERVHTSAKRLQTPAAWENFRRIRNDYIAELRIAKSEYENKLATRLSNQDRSQWQTVKHFIVKRTTSVYPPMCNPNSDDLITDNVDKAKRFNEFFCSHSNINTQGANLPAFADTGDPHLDDVTVSPDEINDILKSLKTGKATGPDGISPRMLKEAASSIAPSLAHLINFSLQSHVFPAIWKRANVIPLYKKNDKSKFNNYRPISLISCVGKVMERVVFKNVFNHFKDNNLFTPFQSGFMPGDSTVNQLVHVYHLINQALDKQKEVRIVFCDISKAFDRVWHDGLIYKLQVMGIGDNLLSWFRNYLSQRVQRVLINGSCSAWGNITAGVPQGSVLGPLLFLVYINDIAYAVNSQIRLFADDTTLFVTVDNPIASGETLNNDLDALHQWSQQWLVSFSPEKTVCMTASRKKNKPVHPPLIFNAHTLQEVNSHKQLGVIFSSDLMWSNQILDICLRAGKRVDILAHLKYRLDRKTLEILYFSYIRPILEYGDVVWGNCSKEETGLLEEVQLRAARIISGAIRGTSHVRIYEELCWEPLEKRRDRHALILFHKMTVGAAPDYLVDMLPPKVSDRNPYNVRNPNDYTVVGTRTESFRKSFLPKTILLWNSLPLDLRIIDCPMLFKQHLVSSCPRSNPYFYCGGRKISLILSRLRMKCSILKNDLFNLHIIDNSACSCGYPTEDAFHFFFICPLYARQRVTLHNSIYHLGPFTLHTLLYGLEEADTTALNTIYNAVYLYITDSGRFDQ